MKTLILFGSPRPHGDTMALIAQMQKYLLGQVDILDAYRDHLRPCMDCRSCWTKEGCVIRDRMSVILNDLDSYDNVIIASPLYFSQLTGALLSLCSRFQVLYTARKFRGVSKKTTPKQGILVLAGGGDGRSQPAETMANILFGCLNTTCQGVVLSHHTNEIPASEDAAAMQQAKDMALLLNTAYQEKQLVAK